MCSRVIMPISYITSFLRKQRNKCELTRILAGPQSVFRNDTCELKKKKKSKGEPELKHNTVYYVSANYSDFTKQSIVCVCLLIQTSLVNSGQKNTCRQTYPPPTPVPPPSGGFLVVCYIFLFSFFSPWLFCFVFCFHITK